MVLAHLLEILLEESCTILSNLLMLLLPLLKLLLLLLELHLLKATHESLVCLLLKLCSLQHFKVGKRYLDFEVINLVIEELEVCFFLRSGLPQLFFALVYALKFQL